MDNLSNALVNLKNCESASKEECIVKPASKLIGGILRIMQKSQYIDNFEFIDDGKAGYYKIKLNKNINNCKAIKPRYAVKHNDYKKWEKRYLPADGFGVLIISTPKGIISHNEAQKIKTGGKLIAFVY